VVQLLDRDPFDEAPVAIIGRVPRLGRLVAGKAAGATSGLGVLEVEEAPPRPTRTAIRASQDNRLQA
jgi:hypothetical protein